MNTPILATSQPVSPTEQLLQQHLQQAWQALKQQDTAAAMLAAKNATTMAPDSPELAHVLGVLAMRDDRLDLALPLLQKALNGQVTAKKLLDMAQALLLNQQATMALTAANDALAQFGNTPEALGLKSAIEVALEDWAVAKQSAQTAIMLKPSLMAWESNLGFCQLMQAEFKTGLQSLTGRAENLPAGSRAPAFNAAQPCALWLKNEQGPGDTLFNLRYAPMLVAQGYQLHIQTDKKTKTLLRNTGWFASVKEDFTCPQAAFWLNVGDLPLAGMQATGQEIVPPLPLSPEPERVEKLRKKLAEIGPAPYVAVTWRAGPKGKKLRNGLRAFTKGVAPEWLGEALKHTQATVISLQRLPTAEENAAFTQGLGRAFADLSPLNDQLQDMLALLSLMDAYMTVPNTNLHLRESLGLSSLVFVNRPFQDWRWLAEGDMSPWYPNATIIRQAKNGQWAHGLVPLAQYLTTQTGQKITHQTVNTDLNLTAVHALHQEIVVQAHSDQSLKELLVEGWQAVNQGQIAAAIKVAQNVLQKAPDYPEALHLLGWAAYRDLKGDLALALLKKATELAPSNGAALGDYIRALTANRQYDEALNLANTALQTTGMGNLQGVYYARAAVNLQLNQLHDAIADYDACLAINPNYLDALAFNGLARLKVGDAYHGFRYYSARPEARTPARMDGLVCPWLRGDVRGLKVLIKRDMGLGDELSFLRYLPWLTDAGVEVDYWAGKKLVPLLTRMAYASRVLSDEQAAPEADAYDLTCWVHELPVAVEALNAPEIAPPLVLSPRPDLVEKWRAWLSRCGPAPYIGVNWKAGVGTAGAAGKFSKLSKEIDAQSLATALEHVNGTVISLQRNVMLAELTAFEQALTRPLHDAVSLTDDLEDLLALQALLDENIGVSNTNMHLRAGLGLGSRVLVQCPGGDWRWGYEGNTSLWFEHSKVYRQQLDGHWTSALHALSQDLTTQYPQKLALPNNAPTSHANHVSAHKVIWLTAGKLEATATGHTSDLASARYRVILPAAELTRMGLNNVFVNESISQAMGGWGSHTPQSGDTLVISKVFTTHALALANDAKNRGANVVVDFCDNFFDHPTRGPLQKALLAVADQVVASTEAMAEVLAAQGKPTNVVISDYKEAQINESQQNIIARWLEATSNQNFIPTKMGKNIKDNRCAEKVRLLVGILYSGENEFEQVKSALNNQKHKNFKHFVIQNKPNKEAHDLLYASFMAQSEDYDYFLKLDADMVLAHDNVLEEMINACLIDELSHLFAYVKDCPSSIMIPGIQMFKSDTQWLGSDEQLNVDYAPKNLGKSKTFINNNWVLHMPDPSEYQLFRYGIHKALKSLQPDRSAKNIKKGILHISILNGIARNATNSKPLWFALMGATLVYQKAFLANEYNGELTHNIFNKLKENHQKHKDLIKVTQEFWANEIQVSYWWIDNFLTFKH